MSVYRTIGPLVFLIFTAEKKSLYIVWVSFCNGFLFGVIMFFLNGQALLRTFKGES